MTKEIEFGQALRRIAKFYHTSYMYRGKVYSFDEKVPTNNGNVDIATLPGAKRTYANCINNVVKVMNLVHPSEKYLEADFVVEVKDGVEFLTFTKFKDSLSKHKFDLTDLTKACDEFYLAQKKASDVRYSKGLLWGFKMLFAWIVEVINEKNAQKTAKNFLDHFLKELELPTVETVANNPALGTPKVKRVNKAL